MGCGDGRVLVEALRSVPTLRAVGIDWDPEAVSRARANLAAAGVADRATVVAGDFFASALPWGDVTVVVLYLLPAVLDRLLPLLRSTLRRGVRLFCVCFSFSDETVRLVRSLPFPTILEVDIFSSS